MARGDSISQIAYTASGSYDYIVPASGDEWMITHWGTDEPDVVFYMLDSPTFRDMAFPTSPIPESAGASSVTTKLGFSALILQPMKWFINQTDGYIRYSNASQNHNSWWMGIKTKE